jgi:pimeloyl-ACP methyl ester carboxylesterase
MNSEVSAEPLLQTMRLSSGVDLAFRTAGAEGRTAVLLLHGFPSSSRTFRQVIGPLSEVAYVVAPDLPGFGASDVLARPSFAAFTDCVEDLLGRLGVGRRFIYLHDFGAPVGLRLAMRSPDLVAGLIVQNANAHRSGLGPQWADTLAFWSAPNARNEAAATAHLTAEGVRDEYFANLPADVAARIAPESWIEDWRIMNLPGRMETQRALVADYASHVAQFDAIASYLDRRRPPALLLWGRHDPYFELAEAWSWLKALPRLEAHIFDGAHLLLETHPEEAGRLMRAFVTRHGQPEAEGPPRPEPGGP